MASRQTVKEAVVRELRQASSPHIADTDVTLRDPDDVEDVPHIVYSDTYTPRDYNRAGAGPDRVDTAADGSVNAEIWREYVRAQFLVDVRAGDEDTLEPIYEDVKRHFHRYTHKPWKTRTDFHGDVTRVRVDNVETVDTSETDDVIRGDRLSIAVDFHREYDFSETNITQINHEVDADTDSSTAGITYTTT